jgi:hypothetical protein
LVLFSSGSEFLRFLGFRFGSDLRVSFLGLAIFSTFSRVFCTEVELMEEVVDDTDLRLLVMRGMIVSGSLFCFCFTIFGKIVLENNAQCD